MSTEGLRHRRPSLEVQSSGLAVVTAATYVAGDVCDLEIDCVAFEDKTDNGGRYTVYVVTLIRNGVQMPNLLKRYSEFLDLFEELRKDHPTVESFNFPSKTYTGCGQRDKQERVLRFNILVKVIATLPGGLPEAARDFFFPGAAKSKKGRAADAKKGQEVERATSFIDGPSPHGAASQTGGGGGGGVGLASPGKVPVGGGYFGRSASTSGRGGSPTGVGSAGGGAADTLPGAKEWHADWRALFWTALEPRSLHKNFPIGDLRVTLAEAFGLPAADFGLSSDPYCVATLTGYWSHGQEWPEAMRTTFRTATKYNSLNPVWSHPPQTLSVPRSGGVLRLEVFDFDSTSPDELLGFVELPLEALLSGSPISAWLRLKPAKQFSSPPSAGLGDKPLRPVAGSGKLGKHACVLVHLRYRVAPYGDALTALAWPEDPKVYVGPPFDIERTLTEVFKTLRLIQPIIQFFSADDETGLLDNWYWTKVHRSAAWACFLFVLYTKLPFAIWSFFQAYAVYVSYRQRGRRRRALLNYRVGRLLRRALGVPYGKPINEVRGGAAALQEASAVLRVPISPNAAAFDPLDKHGVNLLEGAAKSATAAAGAVGAGAGAVVGAGAFAVNAVTFGLAGRVASTLGDGVESVTGLSSPRALFSHTGLTAGKGAPCVVAPADLRRVAAQIDHALDPSNPPRPPAFWGKPEGAGAVFDAPRAVYYDDAERTERNMNWLPEDDFAECQFGLAGASKSLIDQLIKLIKGPWMDKVETLLIKTNRILNALHLLFDWREPGKCKTIGCVLAASAVLHLFVRFSLFMLAVNAFLFVFFTPAYATAMTWLPLIPALRKRIAYLKAAQLPPGAKACIRVKRDHSVKEPADDDNDDDDDDDDNDGGVDDDDGGGGGERPGGGSVSMIGGGAPKGKALGLAPLAQTVAALGSLGRRAGDKGGAAAGPLGVFKEGALDGVSRAVHPLLHPLLPRWGTMKRLRKMNDGRMKSKEQGGYFGQLGSAISKGL